MKNLKATAKASHGWSKRTCFCPPRKKTETGSQHRRRSVEIRSLLILSGACVGLGNRGRLLGLAFSPGVYYLVFGPKKNAVGNRFAATVFLWTKDINSWSLFSFVIQISIEDKVEIWDHKKRKQERLHGLVFLFQKIRD